MTCPLSTATANRLMVAVTAKVWAVAGLIGPVVVSRFRDLTLLFAGSLPDILVALVNSVILPSVAFRRRRAQGRGGGFQITGPSAQIPEPAGNEMEIEGHQPLRAPLSSQDLGNLSSS